MRRWKLKLETKGELSWSARCLAKVSPKCAAVLMATPKRLLRCPSTTWRLNPRASTQSFNCCFQEVKFADSEFFGHDQMRELLLRGHVFLMHRLHGSVKLLSNGSVGPGPGNTVASEAPA